MLASWLTLSLQSERKAAHGPSRGMPCRLQSDCSWRSDLIIFNLGLSSKYPADVFAHRRLVGGYCAFATLPTLVVIAPFDQASFSACRTQTYSAEARAAMTWCDLETHQYALHRNCQDFDRRGPHDALACQAFGVALAFRIL